MDHLQEGYSALLISILCNCSPEHAFEKLENPAVKDTRNNLSVEDVMDMMKFKSEGLTYKEIGEIYGIDQHAVFKRIKRFKDKLKVG